MSSAAQLLHNAKHIFVTGTDTDVGKSVASAWLVQKLQARYWKPIQSGLDGRDVDVVRRLAALDEARIMPTAVELQEPLSPHEAARREGRVVPLSALSTIPEGDGTLVIEGAGGVMVPINDQALMLDLMQALAVPVVLVARSGLGTINHTLLSLMALRSRNIPILGVIVSGVPAPHNVAAISTP
jgi:dethiobiotin synthetase/malonyl-CoA O-methyltransferase